MDNDSELVAGVRAGDQAAANELVHRHEGAVFAVALARTGNATDARDVAQEALVKALRSLGKLRDGAKFGPWCVRIAVRLAADHRRRRRRLFSLQGDRLDPAPGPVERMEIRERRERILEELVRLPEEIRRVFLLRYLEGARYAKIAQLLEISTGTVAWMLHRARRSLRTSLRDLAEDDDEMQRRTSAGYSGRGRRDHRAGADAPESASG